MKKIMIGILIMGMLAGIWIWGYCSNRKVEAYEVAVKEKIDARALIEKLKPELDPQIRDIIATSIDRYSEEYDLDPALVVSVIARESSFVQTATSTKDCRGLMQINPKAHPEKIEGLGPSLYHVDNNIRVGCQILREYLDAAGNVQGALKKYVGGAHPTYVPDILAMYTELMVGRNNG